MQLAKKEYQDFEDIVGPEYITQEPVILDTYCQVWGNKLFFGQKHSTRPAAVLLPANTGEIQAIVKACNRYGILFKAFSSGFEYLSLSLEKEKGILLDTRRMNRILEIDARNMHAVVEPYVPVYKLQLEAAKSGLFTGRIGVGYSAGVIATSCCHHEMSRTMVSTSGYGRNVLGVEWVLPTGELLKLGTCESSNGWFSADGPGFSLRGILRGRSGANGGHGVITKVSVKLYPWYGPPEWEQVKQPGETPSRGQIEKVPDGYKVFIITFPTMGNMLDASLEIAHAEIAYSLSTGGIDTGPYTEGNDEEYAMLQKAPPDLENLFKCSVSVLIGAHSARRLAYREKCLLAISEKHGGKLLPQFNTDPKGLARSFINHVWSTGPNPLRATGDFLALASYDSSDGNIRRSTPTDMELLEPYLQSGAFYSPMRVGVILRPQEHFSVGACAGLGFFYDPYDDFSLKAAHDYERALIDPKGKFVRAGLQARGGVCSVESVSRVHQRWGPLYDNYDVWLRKVKKMLDPNSVADWSAYIPSEYPERRSKA